MRTFVRTLVLHDQWQIIEAASTQYNKIFCETINAPETGMAGLGLRPWPEVSNRFSLDELQFGHWNHLGQAAGIGKFWKNLEG